MHINLTVLNVFVYIVIRFLSPQIHLRQFWDTRHSAMEPSREITRQLRDAECPPPTTSTYSKDDDDEDDDN